MKKYFSRILILTGIILIGISLYIKISTTYYQNKLVNEYSAYINSLKEEVTTDGELGNKGSKGLGVPGAVEDVEGSNGLSDTGSSEDSNSTIAIGEDLAPKKSSEKFDLAKFLQDKEISGLLEIPKLKVSAAILEGTDDSALKYTVGHYPGFGEIGEVGNYVLLGHRNYLYGHFFRNIDKLQIGDEINITKDNETYTYLVTDSFVVSPADVWVLEQTSEPTITLITCTPIGTYTDRLIVKGVLNN